MIGRQGLPRSRAKCDRSRQEHSHARARRRMFVTHINGSSRQEDDDVGPASKRVELAEGTKRGVDSVIVFHCPQSATRSSRKYLLLRSDCAKRRCQVPTTTTTSNHPNHRMIRTPVLLSCPMKISLGTADSSFDVIPVAKEDMPPYDVHGANWPITVLENAKPRRGSSAIN